MSRYETNSTAVKLIFEARDGYLALNLIIELNKCGKEYSLKKICLKFPDIALSLLEDFMISGEIGPWTRPLVLPVSYACE